MARAKTDNSTTALVDPDPEDRVLIERLIELVQSFEDRVISPQARADVLLQVCSVVVACLPRFASRDVATRYPCADHGAGTRMLHADDGRVMTTTGPASAGPFHWSNSNVFCLSYFCANWFFCVWQPELRGLTSSGHAFVLCVNSNFR
jgi:hypothetical protein